MACIRPRRTSGSLTALWRIGAPPAITRSFSTSLDVTQEVKAHAASESPDTAPVAAAITETLRLRHKLVAGDPDDFTVRTQEEIASVRTETTRTMTTLLAAIAGVSLLVGGIGIMNIMLVSVTERTREIGLRLAIGARGKDVLLQFLVEAIVISLFGGLLGIGLGFGLSEALERFLSWPTSIPPNAIAT